MTFSIADPFELPDWLGTEDVIWRAETRLAEAAYLSGALSAAGDRVHPLDLLAVDAAFPRPVCPEDQRAAAHRAWHYGEVVLLDVDGRLAAAVPGTQFDANTMCEVLRRVAKAVGASTGNFTVCVTL